MSNHNSRSVWSRRLASRSFQTNMAASRPVEWRHFVEVNIRNIGGGHICWESYDSFNFAGWHGRCGCDDSAPIFTLSEYGCLVAVVYVGCLHGGDIWEQRCRNVCRGCECDRPGHGWLRRDQIPACWQPKQRFYHRPNHGVIGLNIYLFIYFYAQQSKLYGTTGRTHRRVAYTSLMSNLAEVFFSRNLNEVVYQRHHRKIASGPGKVAEFWGNKWMHGCICCGIYFMYADGWFCVSGADWPRLFCKTSCC